MLWFIYVLILGLVIGSFVNVVIYRVPRGQSIIRGRSKCPSCGKKLAWYDLVPVFSFLILKGRCHSCKGRISRAYPLIELCSGLIFLASYQLFAHVDWAHWLFAVFVLELFLILALIDLRHLILPDSLLLVLLGGTAIFYGFQKWFSFGEDPWAFSLGNLIGAALLFTIFFLIWLSSKGQWLGFGDVKLAGIVGLIFGFWGGLTILYVAIIVGALLGLFLLLARRAYLKTKLPLGTLICFSAIFYVLGGENFLNKIAPVFYVIPAILK